MADETKQCLDDGTCHHECATSCFRVAHAGPLSGAFPGDRWPDEILAEHGVIPKAPKPDRDERVERYVEGISEHLHRTSDRWSYYQYRPAISADTSSVVEAAKGAIEVADAELADLRAEVERLRSLVKRQAAAMRQTEDLASAEVQAEVEQWRARYEVADAEAKAAEAALAAVRSLHRKEYATVSDEVHETNPMCSCGQSWTSCETAQAVHRG